MGLSLLVASFLVTTAQAAPKADLITSLGMASGARVDQTARYTATVKNVGGSTASSVSITVQLPATHTSPQVYVLGQLGAVKPGCTLSGTTLTCPIGTLRKNASVQVWFDIALPWNAADLVFTSNATTSSSEASTSNNSSTGVASIAYEDVVLTGDTPVFNDHCTGTNLTAYYECELFPSSISSHDATLYDDGTIGFPFPGYSGAWWQDADDHLAFEYYEGTDVIAEFSGNGVDGDCFEGLTTFPGSTWVSPYRVCR